MPTRLVTHTRTSGAGGLHQARRRAGMRTLPSRCPWPACSCWRLLPLGVVERRAVVVGRRKN